MRYADGMYLGERSMGTLLVMGSQRDMGFCHCCFIFGVYPYAATANTSLCDLMDAARIVYFADDNVDRGELSAGGTREHSCVWMNGI